ncbi:MAG: hypothetical protein ABFD07_19680 [Methanobacterium sp.]
MTKLGNLRKLCTGCDENRWCNDGKCCTVGEFRCKKPYSVCRKEDIDAEITEEQKMRKAEEYPNTVEFAAEQLYNIYNDKYCDGRYKQLYSELSEKDKEYFKDFVITVLNAINYFEGKSCSDCGYFDSEEKTCFGEDREHDEKPGGLICKTFAPKSLVEERVLGGNDN